MGSRTAVRSRPSPAVRLDRAAGVVVASAAGDALGAPHEFGLALPPETQLTMSGGGVLGWEAGEWTDDTQQALAVLTALADAGTAADPLPAVEAGLRAWFAAGPRDVGIQTRAVFRIADREGGSLTSAAAAHHAERPNAAGNGSLMRTGPAGLVPGGPAPAAELAAAVSALTHPHPDAVDACVLWSAAIARALDGPVGAPPDWIDLVATGLDRLPPERRAAWRARLEGCRTAPPEGYDRNGWVVAAFEAALAVIVQTDVPAGASPCHHLRLAVERAVRIGDDTDTVAAIAGALLGAYWGASAVPHTWRRPLHGLRVEDAPPLRVADLDRLARLAASGGAPDAQGWPGVPELLPHYTSAHPARPVATDLVDGVRVGNVHALPTEAEEAEAVVSLCRLGTADLPVDVEHHVVGLIDSDDPADNPNLVFALTDTADMLAALVAEGKRVFVHCVQAEHRTPAVAAAFLVRHHGRGPEAALDEVERLLGGRPGIALAAGVRQVRRADGPTPR